MTPAGDATKYLIAPRANTPNKKRTAAAKQVQETPRKTVDQTHDRKRKRKSQRKLELSPTSPVVHKKQKQKSFLSQITMGMSPGETTSPEVARDCLSEDATDDFGIMQLSQSSPEHLTLSSFLSPFPKSSHSTNPSGTN